MNVKAQRALALEHDRSVAGQDLRLLGVSLCSHLQTVEREVLTRLKGQEWVWREEKMMLASGFHQGRLLDLNSSLTP